MTAIAYNKAPNELLLAGPFPSVEDAGSHVAKLCDREGRVSDPTEACKPDDFAIIDLDRDYEREIADLQARVEELSRGG